mgnify:CR=1 FL=1|jgi:6-pyruvoyltetrahydropterin/6-carboxytetrahydropterin synthase
MNYIDTITKRFEFEYGHYIPNHPGKCINLHGHTGKLEITVRGVINGYTGMIMDFSDLKKIVNEEIIEKLDHNFLNDMFDLPTAENIGNWIWDKLEEKGLNIYRLRLWETSDSYFERVSIY